MQIGKMIRAMFRPENPQNESVSGEAAWSESTIYGSSNFPKYNPDDLIGRKGAGIYRKMMTDEQVKAVVRFKRDAITSRQWFFECEHETLSEDERESRVKFFESAMRCMRGSFIDALNGIMSAMYNGFSMTEKVLATEEIDGQPMIVISALKLRPFDTFFFHVDGHGNVIKVVQKFESQEQEIDIARFIHFVQNPDYDEHYGSSELREAYRAWFSKDITIRMQNIFLERMAAGFMWITPKDGKTLNSSSTEFAQLKSVLANITTKTAIILPSGVDLNIQNPQNTDAYQMAVSQHDKAIAKALLVPNLMGISEQGTTGSYSQSQTQLEAFLWTLEADASRLCEALNEQLFRELGDMNYGDGLYPVFKFKPISDDKKYKLVQLWKDLVTASAVTASDSDESKIRQMLDMPEREESAEMPETEEKDPPKEHEELPDETVVGRTRVVSSREEAKPSCGHNHEPIVATKAAFSQAMKRVDFAVIGSKSDDSSDQSAYQVASVNGDAVARMIDDASKIGYEVDLVMGIKFASNELAAMKKEVIAGLAEGWKIGSQHAQKELRKASKDKFGREHFATTDRALTDIAGDYFKSRAHTITGNISGATQSIIQNTLLEGIKNSKAFAETKKAIYKALESEGLLTEDDITEALGTVTVKNTKARIQTIMRTSTFEAINEARYQYFSDPALGGFVEALEYSAILDDRTTDICEDLNGRVFATNSEEWQTYAPPNHYNCRSLLIPVTENDTWTTSEPPNVMPQKGFGFTKRISLTLPDGRKITGEVESDQ